MTIIEAVRSFLNGYPGLEGNKLNVDFLPPDAATYSVDVVPVKSVIKLTGTAPVCGNLPLCWPPAPTWGPDYPAADRQPGLL